MTTKVMTDSSKIDLKNQYGEHASTIERYGYMAFFLGQNIVFGVMMVALQAFWQYTLLVPLEAIGIIFLVARAWDAINDPMIAAYIQKTKPKKGKFKPWAFLSSFTLPIITIIVFININPTGNTDTSLVILYALVTYVIYGMIYTLCDVPALSMSLTIEPDQKRRTSLIIMARIGAAAAGIFTSFLFLFIASQVGEVWGYTIAAIVLGFIAMLFMMCISFGKERNVQDASNDKVTFKKMWIFITQNKHLMKIIVIKTIIAFFCAGVYAIIPTLIFSGFITSSSSLDPFTTVMTATAISGFLFVFGIMYTTKRWGKRKTTIIWSSFGGLVTLLGVIMMAVSGNTLWAFSIFAIGSVIILMTSVNMNFMFVPDTIEYSHYKTGIRQEAMGTATSSFTTKLDMALQGFFASFVMAFMGVMAYSNPTDTQIEEQIQAAENVYIFFAVVILLGSVAVATLWGLWWNLDRHDVQKMAKLNISGKYDSDLDDKLGINREIELNLAEAYKNLCIARENLDPKVDKTVKMYITANQIYEIWRVTKKETYKKAKEIKKDIKRQTKIDKKETYKKAKEIKKDIKRQTKIDKKMPK